MTDLSTLLERVRGATEGSRELDAAVAVAIGDYRLWKSKHGYWNVEAVDGVRFTYPGRLPDFTYDPSSGAKLGPEATPWEWVWDSNCPDYSTSLDAALSLVERKLPDAFWQVGHDSDDPAWFRARIFTGRLPGQTTQAEGATPALALIAALLQALEGTDHD